MRSSDIRSIDNLACERDSLDIRWRVTTLCNYQCDFCIQGNREEHLRKAQGDSSKLREQICGRLIERIENQKRYHNVKIGLIGGEVTILKDFPGILEALSGSRFKGEIKFHMTTNFSPEAALFQRLCDIVQSSAQERRLHISASFYPAYTTREAFVAKLREVDAYAGATQGHRSPVDVLLRRKRGRKVLLTAGIPILNDADYRGFLDMCAAFEGTSVGVSPIVIRKYPTDISDANAKELLNRERKNLRVVDADGRECFFQNIQALGMALEDGDSFRPAGCRCDAGVHSIWVDAFGNVKRCPALGSTMELGSLLNDGFQLLTAPEVCTSNHCSCNQFGRIER